MSHRGTRVRSRLFAALATCALILTFIQVAGAQAQAVNATDFNPSTIISDAEFYNGAAMTTPEIQSFLNQRVPRCTIGDPGRLPWTPYGSTYIASVCLKDAKFTTTTRAANAYCQAYVGAANESAAAIINKVSRACNISPKVLMVMLEKEQSLITDTWPTALQYDRAMGYACPDSGPNNSANCDPTQTGFSQQVYRAAWQLQVYKAFPNSYNYRPFQFNTIQWNPNAACGTSQVYINNWATAALYIYTPYRPNQAALNAGWGVGDSCSSYGNRNFFLLYNTWFTASPVPVIPGQKQIDAKYAQNGWLGAATSEYLSYTVNGGGTVRAFQNGAITWAQGSGAAYIVTGDFRTYFNGRGGLSGFLGWPSSDATAKGDGPGRTQGFQGGAVAHQPQYGFATLTGGIRSHYASAALAFGGPLGWPTAEQNCTSSGNCTQSFEQGTIKLTNNVASISIPAIDSVATAQRPLLGAATGGAVASDAHGGGFVQGHANGAIAWSKTNGAFSLSGSIRQAFGANGGLTGYLGWPTSAQTCTSTGNCTQSFMGGTITLDPQGRTSVMGKSIATAYDALIDAGIDIGPSLGDTRTVTGSSPGLVHPFGNGAIAGANGQSAFALMEPIRPAYNTAGGIAGPLGWPTNNALSSTSNGGGIVQGFEGGAIVSSAPGTYILSGTMRTKYGSLGGLQGTLGWPTANILTHTLKGGGTVQPFQNGVLVQRSGSTAPVLLDGEIRRVFGEAGGLGGTPGWPISDARVEAANGGGRVQGFQDAAIVSSTSGTYMLTGPLRTYYNAQGGLTGQLGWPTSAMTCLANECQQSFQGGTLIWNSQTQQGSVLSITPRGAGPLTGSEQDQNEESETAVPLPPDSGDNPRDGGDDAVPETERERLP